MGHLHLIRYININNKKYQSIHANARAPIIPLDPTTIVTTTFYIIITDRGQLLLGQPVTGRPLHRLARAAPCSVPSHENTMLGGHFQARVNFPLPSPNCQRTSRMYEKGRRSRITGILECRPRSVKGHWQDMVRHPITHASRYYTWIHHLSIPAPRNKVNRLHHYGRLHWSIPRSVHRLSWFISLINNPEGHLYHHIRRGLPRSRTHSFLTTLLTDPGSPSVYSPSPNGVIFQLEVITRATFWLSLSLNRGSAPLVAEGQLQVWRFSNILNHTSTFDFAYARDIQHNVIWTRIFGE
jgi:hypothetical protein